jgi:S-formylglutathione hydrolase
METYLTQELPELISQHVPEANLKQLALSGHSMGGHGALTLAFKNPDLFQSASAFAPICSPMETPWGQKAFQAYLGDDKQDWAAHDASHLATQTAWRRPLLIDQGSSDQFLKEQLDPSRLQAACREAQIPLAYDLHPGYDHSYYFVATFLQKHFKHHQEVLMSVE